MSSSISNGFLIAFDSFPIINVTIPAKLTRNNWMGISHRSLSAQSIVPSVYPTKRYAWHGFNIEGFPDNVLRRIFKLLVYDGVYQSTYVHEILRLVCTRWRNIINTLETCIWKSVDFSLPSGKYVHTPTKVPNKPHSVVFIGPDRYIHEHLIMSAPPREPSNLPTTRNSHFMYPTKPARMSNNHKGALRTRGPHSCKHR